MGALGHYLESEGLATASISLIRLHTEKIRPPRALWVPFELGRPLGVPGDPAFQTRVLHALLDLLTVQSGPVLADYPEDTPQAASESDMTGMACLLRLDAPPVGEETLEEAVLREIRELHPWYDLASERRGRTTFGVCGLPIEDVARVLFGWLSEPSSGPEIAGLAPEELLKVASEDLKTFYFEAAGGQPQPFSGRPLADWFWGETVAARLLLAVRERLGRDPDPVRRRIGLGLTIPRDQWLRLGLTENS